MELTGKQTVQTGEKNFIDTLNAELDWEAVEKLLVEKHNFMLQDDVDYVDGDLIVHNNQIAYRLDFDVRISLSLIIGRDGECLEVTTSGEVDKKADGPDVGMSEDRADHGNLEQGGVRTFSDQASSIAEMISEINRD